MADDPSRTGDAAEEVAATRGTDADSAADADSSPQARPENDDDTRDDRGVVVPTAVYKRVTVFSTLIAVVAVVGGFLVLDVATDRATAELSEIDPLVALVGVGLIAFGAVTYAFSTRFRAEGMGNAKDDTDEPSNNG
ncbi:DUF7315 family membrane protein [Halosimplex amylolyticum]|uniref:DUF7315 family membrane protein n=1 Tax=Halosimplex amylolyticum TaxID=3396616 RepID=UPI003F55E951